MKCPNDAAELIHVTRHGVGIDHCPACGGVWLERGELDKVIEAVRPPVVLDNPEPEQEQHAPPHRPVVQPEPAREKRVTPAKPPKSHGKRFGGAYSRKAIVKSLIEEIFDFD